MPIHWFTLLPHSRDHYVQYKSTFLFQMNVLSVTCLFGLSRHMVMCQRPRNTCGHTSVLFTWPVSSRFQPIITQKLWHLFLRNLHILMPSYTVLYIPNVKEIAPAVPEIRVPETRWIFFVFFFIPSNESVCKLCSCSPISTKFGTQIALPKPYISTKFCMIRCKIEENIKILTILLTRLPEKLLVLSFWNFYQAQI